MHIQWRDEKNKDLGYFLLNEDGSEILQGHIKPAQRERARKQKKSFEAVILEDYAEKASKDETTPVRDIKIVRVEAEPHFHDDRYLLALPEHSHDEYIQNLKHEHPQIDELTRDARAHEMANLEAFRLTDKALIEHKHPGFAQRDHEHPLEEHDHPHEHAPVWHDHEQYEAQVKAMQSQLSDLNGRLVAVTQEWRTLLDAQAEAFKAALKELAGAKHGHDEYATDEALAQHIENATRKASLVVLSQEETGGRRRLIVEEVN